MVNRDTLRADGMAALAGAIIVLPQGVAFATLAGMPPQYGLYAAMVPAIIAELKKQGADDIIVFVGGVIPRQDYDFLYQAGVKGIYGPGTPIPVSARDVLSHIQKSLAN